MSPDGEQQSSGNSADEPESQVRLLNADNESLAGQNKAVKVQFSYEHATQKETNDDRHRNKGQRDQPKAVDQITDVIGEIGRWQLQNIAIVFFVSIPGLSHIFASTFITPKTDFWCIAAEVDPEFNFTKNECIDTCCEYDHDQTVWKSTIITEFDLVCERESLPLLAKMLFFSAIGLGNFLSGLFSDTYGRKSALLFFSMVLLISGVACGFMPNYATFVAAWMVVGVATVANYTIAFVWAMEALGGKWKNLLGMSMPFAWPFSRLFPLTVSWLLVSWRSILQVISAPCAIAPLVLYFLPESPRWLLAKGKTDEAKHILVKALRKNRANSVNLDNIRLLQPPLRKKSSVLNMMRYPMLRKKVLIMYFNWFASAFMQYGIALNWQHLTGDLFTNFLMSSLLDFPAKLFAMLSSYWFGRKRPFLVLNLIAGVLYGVILFIPRGVYYKELPIVILFLICSFCVSACLSILWIWMTELMPTRVRNVGVGSASMLARVGGVLATTMGKAADLSPLIPVSLFAVAALGSFFLSAFLPETQGIKMQDTADESEDLKVLTVNELLKCKKTREDEDDLSK